MISRLSIIIFCLIITNLPLWVSAQREPISLGPGSGAGSITQLPGQSGNAATLGLRLDVRIPVLSAFISAHPNTGWEYAFTRIESNNVGKTLQTARAQFLRAGMSLNVRLHTSNKKTGLELGCGLLFRRKFYESSDWQLTGGQPITYFPKSQMLAPVQLIRFTENNKRRMNLFAEVLFGSDVNGNIGINGISAGVQWHWYAKQRKQYFKGTHRTMQWDDVWPAQVY
jgi:hypothetical protein